LVLDLLDNFLCDVGGGGLALGAVACGGSELGSMREVGHEEGRLVFGGEEIPVRVHLHEWGVVAARRRGHGAGGGGRRHGHELRRVHVELERRRGRRLRGGGGGNVDAALLRHLWFLIGRHRTVPYRTPATLRNE
jgi:hypothetical protein